MVKPAYRSHSLARHKKTTPGNKNVIHYSRRKPKKAHCMLCKRPLQGIPRVRPSQMKKIPKTSRKTTRPYSGKFCASCLQSLIQDSIWIEES